MTRKIKKFKGIDPETGNDIYEVINLSKSEAVLYDILERILEAVEK